MQRVSYTEQKENVSFSESTEAGAVETARDDRAAPVGAPGRSRGKRRRQRGRPPRREAGGASSRLSRGAVRLLEALSAPDAYALPDPLEPGRVVVRAGADRRGVSLSRGAFASADAEALVAADLASWVRASRGRRLAASAAGHAWLKRDQASEAPFSTQHRETVAETRPDPERGAPAKVAVNAAESPLAWLAGRKNRDGTPFLDPAALEAGERFRRDLTMAGVMPGVTVDWSRFGGGGSAQGGVPQRQSMTEALVAARQRIARACDALGGEDADLLIDVCGFLKGLATIERERGWPARSGKMLLARALQRLAAHYGLAPVAQGPERARRIGVWRA